MLNILKKILCRMFWLHDFGERIEGKIYHERKCKKCGYVFDLMDRHL